MVMSNFIDESERHAELYGTYTDRQRLVLEIIEPMNNTVINNSNLIESLHIKGISDPEIEWLKRTGHVLPVYEYL